MQPSTCIRGLPAPEFMVGIARPDTDHCTRLRNPILMISLQGGWLALAWAPNRTAVFTPPVKLPIFLLFPPLLHRHPMHPQAHPGHPHCQARQPIL